jgi:hypothetical protein
MCFSSGSGGMEHVAIKLARLFGKEMKKCIDMYLPG